MIEQVIYVSNLRVCNLCMHAVKLYRYWAYIKKFKKLTPKMGFTHKMFRRPANYYLAVFWFSDGSATYVFTRMEYHKIISLFSRFLTVTIVCQPLSKVPTLSCSCSSSESSPLISSTLPQLILLYILTSF